MVPMADPSPPAAPLRGARDLTKGPIGRTMLAFALPTLGSSALQSLNGSVNAIWVGRLIGETGLTATSNANLLLFLLLSAVFGVGLASTILVGQAMGRQDVAAAKKVVGTSAGFFLGTSIALAILGLVFARPMLAAMGTPEAALPLAARYLGIILAALPFFYFTTFVMMVLRGAGDSRTPFWFMGLAVAVDIALNPVLILGLGPFPALGIGGAAWATVAGQVAGLSAMLAYIYARKFTLRLTRADLHLLRPDAALLRATIVKGTPMGLQMIVITISGLVMIGIVNRYGIQTGAAYAVAMQMWTYVQMPAMAIGAAASSMAAQNVGAGLWRRVHRSAVLGVVINLALTGGLITLIYLVQRPLISVFLPGDPAAAAITLRINALVLWGFPFLGVAFVLFAVMRATGAVIPQLVILVVSLIVVRIPIALMLEPALGADAVWWSSPVSMIVAAAMSVLYYRFGGWRSARMIADRKSAAAPRDPAAGAPVPAR